MMAEIRQVGMIGCGLSGCAIARVIALAGYDVRICELSQALLDVAFQKTATFFTRESMRGALSEQEIYQATSRIHGTLNQQDLLACDLIIDAIPENLEAKSQLLETLDAQCPPRVIFAIHTSSLSVTRMAAGIRRTDRVLGLHFIHPIHIVKLVEVITTPFLHPDVLLDIQTFVRSLKKTPMTVKDTPGFIVNRLMMPYLLNAVRMLEAGVASPEDIDSAMQIGCGHPIGPLALIDFIGIDHICRIAENLHQESQDPQYRLPQLLQTLREQGHLGKLSGQGFYTYPPERH